MSGRRVAEVALAATLLLLLFPILLAAALCIFIEDGGPVVFVHSRIGFGGKSFPCLKLRSMCVDAGARLDALLQSDANARAEWHATQKLRTDPRITVVGRVLRQWSIDELPQLLNVIAGHMSLVGPRPIVAAEVARYGHRITSYFAVRPGLTGLWQVRGRSDTSYRTRIAMDVVYAKRRSIGLDIHILVKTAAVVLSREGSC